MNTPSVKAHKVVCHILKFCNPCFSLLKIHTCCQFFYLIAKVLVLLLLVLKSKLKSVKETRTLTSKVRDRTISAATFGAVTTWIDDRF